MSSILNRLCLLSMVSPKNLAANTGERMASTNLCALNGSLPSAASWNATSDPRPVSSSSRRLRVMVGGGGAATKQFLVAAAEESLSSLAQT